MVIYAEDVRDGFGERGNKVFTPLKCNADSFPA